MTPNPSTKPCKFCQAEIPTNSVKCPKCKKIEWTKRNIALTAIFALFFSWLFISLIPDSPSESPAPYSFAQESIKNRLALGISGANTFTSYATPTSTIDDLNAEVALFGYWAGYVAEGKASSSTEEVASAKELEKKVIAIQTKEFPKLRKEVTRFMRDTLWEGDIEVKVSGTKNETLTLIGAYFAANANIKKTNDTLYPILSGYRFQTVRYAWYDGADWQVFDMTKNTGYLKDESVAKK